MPKYDSEVEREIVNEDPAWYANLPRQFASHLAYLEGCARRGECEIVAAHCSSLRAKYTNAADLADEYRRAHGGFIHGATL